MPSWNVHLEAGQRLANKLKLTGLERKEFLFACLLPDINNGYINKVKVTKQHEETHYTFSQKSSLNFYAENSEKIKKRDPIFLGYLFHLYTDGFFNYDFYRNIKRHKLGHNKTQEEKRAIKHNDFWLYDAEFNHTLGVKKTDLAHLAARANEVSATEISPEDIEDVERIMREGCLKNLVKGKKYQLYSKERLDNLMDDMIESFTGDYLGDDHA